MKKILPIGSVLMAVLLSPLMVFAVESFGRDLYFGLRNDSEVTRLQQFLTDQGIYNGPITGNFFSLSQSAVKKFQEQNVILPVSGYFGPKTRAIANQKISSASAPQSIENQISVLLKKIQELQNQLVKSKQEESAAVPVAPVPIPQPVLPPVLPNPFESSLKIESILGSYTLSSYGEKIITEFRLSANEKIAINRIRFKNSGILSDTYIVGFKLVNSATNEVLAKVEQPVDKYIEFKMAADSAKTDKGLAVSGNTYHVLATILTPAYGSEKPYIRLNIEAVSDVSAFDYNDLNRIADISKSNIFPIEGTKVTVF